MATCISLKPISDVDFLTATVDKKNIFNSIPVIRVGYTLPFILLSRLREQIQEIKKQLVNDKMMFPLKAYENNWIVRTDPQVIFHFLAAIALGIEDVARVESKTWIVTPDKYQTVCHTPPGVEPIMGHWMDPEQFSTELDSSFTGRTMYVIPYSMGPVGGPISKNAVEVEHFIAAAFPSACGKTNLAMLQPTLPGWQTNPMAMATFQKNSIFTNVAETANGEFFWEGMECDLKDPNVEMVNWLGQKWRIGDKGEAAHANSRFTTPASQCPIIHPQWESPKGVPIDAIVFGGRRSAFSFRSNALCCISGNYAEHKGKKVMHDPMAMRPFMGYNFGKYLQHWVNLEKGHKVGPDLPAEIRAQLDEQEKRINAL
uniref:phosphoenolpyruvate carboxykinase (GTP) n=1 Tax=Parascaris equorum TaxID=6256 RepID=A0A914RJL7_PAREQ